MTQAPTTSAVADVTFRHLGIEATHLLFEQRGIGRYVRNVLRELADLYPSLRYTLYVGKMAEREPLLLQMGALHPELPSRVRVATVAELPQSEAQVLWYPWNLVTVPTERAAMVVTTHDLAPMLRLDHKWWKVLKRYKHRRRYQRAMRLAHHVLTDSVYIRDELVRTLGTDASKISVSLLASDDLRIDLPDDGTPLDDAGVTTPFFLTVGGQDVRKNLMSVYCAMEQLWSRGVRVPLVQCGPGLSRETRERLGAVPWLHHVGYVTDQQLATLYRRTTALVYPSRYEGFGLPVAEAMRVGAPVICANSSSLPEVAGDAALQVAWNDIPALVQQMERLLNDASLARSLSDRGRVQAARFSWARTAQETLAVFERTWQAHRVRHGDRVRAESAFTAEDDGPRRNGADTAESIIEISA